MSTLMLPDLKEGVLEGEGTPTNLSPLSDQDEEGTPDEVKCIEHVIQVDQSITLKITSDILRETFNRNINKYLGKGSYSYVYSHEAASGHTVALKQLTQVKTSKCRTKVIDRFYRETEVHRDLKHENVLRFIGVIKDEHVFPRSEVAVVLVIEYAEHGSLQDLMQEELFNRKFIIDFTKQIVQGLHYLHTYVDRTGKYKPIIHRDLRGANILVKQNGSIKIADFGLCKRLYDMAVDSGINSKLGNPYWYSPELNESSKLKGKRGSTLVKIDIWSLGVVILEMYYYGALRVPFIDHFRRENEYTFKLGQGWVPKTPDLAPKEIKTLLKHCFEYEIERRTSAEGLLNIISNFEQDKFRNLLITEEIVPPLQTSSSENTPESFQTGNQDTLVPNTETLELSWEMVEPPTIEQTEDPLGQAAVDDVTKYLTRVFQWQQRPPSREDTDPTSADVTSDKVRYVMEDHQHKDMKYHVKRMNSDQDSYTVTFEDEGKYITVTRELDGVKAYSIDSRNDQQGFLSENFRGGFAQLRITDPLKQKFSRKRMKVTSTTLEGRKKLEQMKSNISLDTAHSSRVTSVQSVVSKLSIRFENRALVIKKKRQSTNEYPYVIRFKSDKVQIAEFKVALEELKCEFVVYRGTDAALVTTVLAFFYKFKSQKKQDTWKNKLIRLTRFRGGGSQYSSIS